jgi:site-specific recombinase XerD
MRADPVRSSIHCAPIHRTSDSEEILSFLSHLTEGAKQSTKRLRFSLLRAFFTFLINAGNERFQNPCDTPILRKIFKDLKPVPWKIVEKETVAAMRWIENLHG